MRATTARAWELSKLVLVHLSAPTLKPEPVYIPVRPPIKIATATIGEVLAAKGVTL